MDIIAHITLDLSEAWMLLHILYFACPLYNYHYSHILHQIVNKHIPVTNILFINTRTNIYDCCNHEKTKLLQELQT